MKLFVLYFVSFCLALTSGLSGQEARAPLEEFALPVSETTAKYLKLREVHFKENQQKFFASEGVPFPHGSSLKLDTKNNSLRIVNHREAILHTMWVLSLIEHKSRADKLEAKEILEAEIRNIEKALQQAPF